MKSNIEPKIRPVFEIKYYIVW